MTFPSLSTLYMFRVCIKLGPTQNKVCLRARSNKKENFSHNRSLCTISDAHDLLKSVEAKSTLAGVTLLLHLVAIVTVCKVYFITISGHFLVTFVLRTKVEFGCADIINLLRFKLMNFLAAFLRIIRFALYKRLFQLRLKSDLVRIKASVMCLQFRCLVFLEGRIFNRKCLCEKASF